LVSLCFIPQQRLQ